MPVFKTGAIGRSATSPGRCGRHLTRREVGLPVVRMHFRRVSTGRMSGPGDRRNGQRCSVRPVGGAEVVMIGFHLVDMGILSGRIRLESLWTGRSSERPVAVPGYWANPRSGSAVAADSDVWTCSPTRLTHRVAFPSRSSTFQQCRASLEPDQPAYPDLIFEVLAPTESIRLRELVTRAKRIDQP